MQSQVRLVHVTTVPQSLGFFHGHVGYLKERGFAVQAISSPGKWADQFAEREAIPVHAVPMARTLSPLRDAVSLFHLWRLFRTLQPEIVHSHTPKAGLLGTLAARAAGVPVVFLSVFGLPQMTKTGVLRSLLNLTTRLACFYADRVWCDSFSMRAHLVQTGLASAEKTVVLGQGSVSGVDARLKFSPDAYDLAARVSVRARYGIPADALVLGYVGRIVGDKGMRELAGSWRVLRKRYANLHLLMLGEFEPKDPLAPDDEILFRTDPRIHLAGFRSDVPAHLAVMDVFVMPSYREGFGISNIEAAAMALPVVSTRIPGCVDSVRDGINGVLVPVHNVEALTQAIEAYLCDPNLRRQHGLAGREWVLRDFRPEAIWEALYQEYLRQLQRK